jgi:hypothetical protein
MCKLIAVKFICYIVSVIEAEMKQFLENSEVTCQELKDKLVLLADHSTVSSHMLQWTVQVGEPVQ